MNPNQTDAYKYLGLAQQARKAGDKRLARQYAEQAARLAPELAEVWMMMGALASPRASVVFLEKALQINPQSEHVRQGMHWAVERLRKEAPRKPAAAVRPAPAQVGQPRISFMAVLLTAMCLVVLASAVLAAPSMASTFIGNSALKGKQNTPSWAAANIAKPAYTLAPSPTSGLPAPVPQVQVSATEGIAPTATTTPIATDTLTSIDTPTAIDTSTPLPSDTPIDVASPTPMEGASATPLATDMIPAGDTAHPSPTPLPTDTPTTLGQAAATQYVPPPVSSGKGGTHWVDVDLTHQMVYAYEGNTIVNSFLVSTGTWQHPTVTGQYHVYVKYRYAHMSGPGYSLPNVPYTMYFYQSYALHGTYWHSNFGTPMSHGCVNLSIPDSEWLYNFSSIGTLVNVHY